MEFINLMSQGFIVMIDFNFTLVIHPLITRQCPALKGIINGRRVLCLYVRKVTAINFL